MDDVTDVLQLIDDAIEDYSVSGDAMRCRPRLLDGYAELGHTRDGDAFGWLPDRIQRLFGVPDWAVEIHRVATVLSDMARELQAAGVIPPPPPVDPMQRALEARRNRNTGPAGRMRVPRRIDARRAR